MMRVVPLLAGLALLGGCSKSEPESATAPAVEAAKPQVVSAQPAAAPVGNTISGTVVETQEAGGYTYARLDTANGEVWAAGPTAPLAVGSQISVTTQMPMANFHSKALNRDFAMLYFVEGFGGASSDADAAVKAAHSAVPVAAAPVQSMIALKKVEGGQTIAEVLGSLETMASQPLKIRGRVTKFNSGIMGKNWIHIEDGSGMGDLTVTTDATVQPGDTVVVEGGLSLNKDFGYGYVYDVIMENAKVTVE